jgi:hypothetical protein
MMPLLAALATVAAAGAPPVGIYTNEEQVEFARAKGVAEPRWLGLEVKQAGGERQLLWVDAYGQPMPAPDGIKLEVDGTGLRALTPDGTALALLPARQFLCWASVPKLAPKADGSVDWWFKTGLPIHDRGGRLSLDTGEAGAPRFALRMRNVVFPEPPNRPSLVLYVHGDDAVRALSYAWADPEAKRLGVNLRSMQASCTLQD